MSRTTESTANTLIVGVLALRQDILNLTAQNENLTKRLQDAEVVIQQQERAIEAPKDGKQYQEANASGCENEADRKRNADSASGGG